MKKTNEGSVYKELDKGELNNCRESDENSRTMDKRIEIEIKRKEMDVEM